MVRRASPGVTSGAMVASPQNLNINRLTGCLRGFELFPGVLPEAEVQLLPRD
jgi:hypothetical protein